VPVNPVHCSLASGLKHTHIIPKDESPFFAGSKQGHDLFFYPSLLRERAIFPFSQVTSKGRKKITLLSNKLSYGKDKEFLSSKS